MSGSRETKVLVGLVGAAVVGLLVYVIVDENSGPDRCLDADQALEFVREGLDASVDISEGSAVQSDDFERAYFVAGIIDGGRHDGAVAVWATNDMFDRGSIYSVNREALDVSDWGDGGATDAAFSLADDGAEEAIDCARS